MFRTKRAAFFALLFAFALGVSACAEDADDTTTTTAADTTTTTAAETTTTAAEETTTLPEAPEGPELKACQVSNTGGIDGKSFNETAWEGMLRAESDLEGVAVEFLESQSTSDFRPNIDSFINEGCDLIITVGFQLADDTGAAARDNADQLFAIIDYPSFIGPITDEEGNGGENVRGINFNTDEAAFLAGYVAASATQTGVVGTFGRMNIPTVTIVMDGFVYGVRYYNEVKGTDVQVLGWDPEAQEGSFTGDSESAEDGRSLGAILMDEGADVILPVAGPVGLGTAAAAQERGGVWIVGVDSDWTASASEYAGIVLTSIMKRMDNAVYATINNVLVLGSLGNEYYGTLANAGVGLGTTADVVSSETLAEIESIKEAIIAGELTVAPASDG
jgi:basic membrane protein A